MTDAPDWGESPRGDTAAPAEALAGVDALLAHPRCQGRPVRYALDGDATALTREEVEAWVTGAEAEGLLRVGYAVDPRGGGPVRVVLSAEWPTSAPDR